MKKPKAWKTQAELVARVEALHKQGMTIKEACESIPVNYTYYYAIKREAKATKPVQAATTNGMGGMSFEEFVRMKREYEEFKGGGNG